MSSWSRELQRGQTNPEMGRGVVHLKVVFALQLPKLGVLTIKTRNIQTRHASTRVIVSSIIIQVERTRSIGLAMVLAVTSCRRRYVQTRGHYSLPPCSRICAVPIRAGLRVACRGPGEWIRPARIQLSGGCSHVPGSACFPCAAFSRCASACGRPSSVGSLTCTLYRLYNYTDGKAGHVSYALPSNYTTLPRFHCRAID
jgi:hypothetical protein